MAGTTIRITKEDAIAMIQKRLKESDDTKELRKQMKEAFDKAYEAWKVECNKVVAAYAAKHKVDAVVDTNYRGEITYTIKIDPNKVTLPTAPERVNVDGRDLYGSEEAELRAMITLLEKHVEPNVSMGTLKGILKYL